MNRTISVSIEDIDDARTYNRYLFAIIVRDQIHGTDDKEDMVLRVLTAHDRLEVADEIFILAKNELQSKSAKTGTLFFSPEMYNIYVKLYSTNLAISKDDPESETKWAADKILAIQGRLRHLFENAGYQKDAEKQPTRAPTKPTGYMN